MPAAPREVPRVLFICYHNAGRSQIAATLFNAYAAGAAEADSAGIEPVRALNIAVIAAMREAGYDLRGMHPRPVSPRMIDSAARIVTIGCSADDAEMPPDLAAEDWDVEDPAGAQMPRVRQIRDDIARRVRRLLREMGIEPAG